MSEQSKDAHLDGNADRTGVGMDIGTDVGRHVGSQGETDVGDAPVALHQRATELAVPEAPVRTLAMRQRAGVAEVRARLAELAANPVLVAAATATATVGTTVAISALRHALHSGGLSRSRAAAPIAVTLQIVQHVHVHHVVHHVVRPALPSVTVVSHHG